MLSLTFIISPLDIFTEIGLNTPHLRTSVYEGHKGICFYTGRFVNVSEASVDHILPKTKNGENCIANYVLTTQSINLTKSNNVDESQIERMRYINIVAFAPLVLERYIANTSQDVLRQPLRVDDDEWTTLPDYFRKHNIRGSHEYAISKALTYETRPKPGQKRKKRHYKVEDLNLYFSDIDT